MARFPRPTRSALLTLVSLLSVSQLASSLQVTPNSPCAKVCQDSHDVDVSDPNSSTTKNSDITCENAAYSSAVGTKFKNCMSCLQTSTFSQGSESDTKWFLYNLRYTAAYCVFGFPNATGISPSPCATTKACGMLQTSLEHGILKPHDTTAYSYCTAGGGEAMDHTNYDSCIPCISAEGRTDYLANYLTALEAGCQQQPAPGVALGLSDTVFSDHHITISDPTAPKDGSNSGTALPTPTIVGIAAGGVVLILIIAAITFICVRKRKNKRARASAEANFYRSIGHRPKSSLGSFQCQTHMVSPRFWPGVGGAAQAPADQEADPQASQSSIWKPHGSFYAGQSPYPQDDSTAYISKKAAMAAVPLHNITTTVPAPPQAYTSPSSAVVHSPSDLKSPLSAESARSTTALLPSIKPYVPSEHGVHVSPTPPPASSFGGSPTSGTGTGTTPLLRSNGWPLQEKQQQQQKPQPQKHIIKLGGSVPPPPPPPLKTSRSSGILGRKSSAQNVGTGSPVESWEVQTAFAAPPKR